MGKYAKMYLYNTFTSYTNLCRLTTIDLCIRQIRKQS